MIRASFFRRHFLVTVAVFAVFGLAAIQMARYLSHMNRADFFRTQGTQFLNAVNQHGSDPVAYVREVNRMNKELRMPYEIDLIFEGKSLLSGEPKDVPDMSDPESRLFVGDLEPQQSLESQEPTKFVMSFAPTHSPRNPNYGYYITLASLFIAILLASGLSLALLFWSIRDKAALARNILGRMQKGDLKARFPTTRLDEMGRMMVLFNQMAEEIERLVEQLKQKEKNRTHLLQDLAHDLRTPVASMRNLLETLRFQGAQLDSTQRDEIAGLAFSESEYLSRLVEDLLFLALVIEPMYKPESDEVRVQEVLQANIGAVASAYPKIKYNVRDLGSSGILHGNAHSMKRLMRNALENAFSFARSRVEIEFQEKDGFLWIRVRDDGPGLTPEQLLNYGKKRSTRFQGQNEGRISVGLGSVIIQAIAIAHGGSAIIQNRIGVSGDIDGAELVIRLRLNGSASAA